MNVMPMARSSWVSIVCLTAIAGSFAGAAPAVGEETKAEAASPKLGEGWKLARSGEVWRLDGDIEAPANISGIASINAETFLLGSDDTRLVQWGRIDRKKRTLTIAGNIDLLGGEDDSEIDIEAIAAAPGEQCFYVTGSHSVSKKGNMNKGRRSVFRLGANKSGDEFFEKAILRESLKDLLERDPILGGFWEKPLQAGGIAIEGLAWRGGNLFFGFRSPNIDDHAIVLEVGSGDLFRKGKVRHKLHRVPVGDGLGIREMTALREGFLIVAGNAGDEPTREFPVARDFDERRGYSVFVWEPKGNSVRLLATLPVTPGRPEAVLTLSENDKAAEFLFLFDGVKGGGPWHFKLDKASKN